MFVRRDTTIFAAVFRFAVDDFHRDDTVRVRHRVVMFGELLPVFVPFHRRWWIASETTKEFARLSDLNDTWSKEEGEAWRRFNRLQPDIITERFSPSDWMQFWSVFWNLLR